MAAGPDRNARIGLSMHGLEGSAELTQGGGKIELTGMGMGVNATAMAGDIYIDAQAAMTRYDVEITSATGMMLKDGADGTGFALAVEAGRPMAMGAMGMSGDLTLTPRAGLAWSQVSLDDFTDTRSAGVSVEDASSLVGRLGLGVETQVEGGLRLAASVDVMQEFQEETEATVGGTALKASAKTSSVRIGLGASHSWGEDRYALQASANYTAGGGDNTELGGGLSLSVRF